MINVLFQYPLSSTYNVAFFTFLLKIVNKFGTNSPSSGQMSGYYNPYASGFSAAHMAAAAAAAAAQQSGQVTLLSLSPGASILPYFTRHSANPASCRIFQPQKMCPQRHLGEASHRALNKAGKSESNLCGPQPATQTQLALIKMQPKELISCLA